MQSALTLEVPVTTAADDILIFFIYLFIFFPKKIIEFSCELSAKQTIHMKFQLIFSEK